METFNIRDLRNRTGELVRNAENGHLSLVTKHGNPVFVALPFNEDLLKSGIKVSLAIGLFLENMVGLASAAKIAGVSPSEMMEILSAHELSTANYSEDELVDELSQFKS